MKGWPPLASGGVADGQRALAAFAVGRHAVASQRLLGAVILRADPVDGALRGRSQRRGPARGRRGRVVRPAGPKSSSRRSRRARYPRCQRACMPMAMAMTFRAGRCASPIRGDRRTVRRAADEFHEIVRVGPVEAAADADPGQVERALVGPRRTRRSTVSRSGIEVGWKCGWMPAAVRRRRCSSTHSPGRHDHLAIGVVDLRPAETGTAISSGMRSMMFICVVGRAMVTWSGAGVRSASR